MFHRHITSDRSDAPEHLRGTRRFTRVRRSSVPDGSHAALLLLRCVLGPLMAGHAAQKLFGWFGADRRQPELEGFADLGYRPAIFFVRAAGVAELATGSLLTMGLLTPVGGALLAATSTQAIEAAKWKNGPWSQDDGYEYLLVLAACGLLFAFLGGGRYSLDAAWKIDVSGRRAGMGTGVIALASVMLPHSLPWPESTTTAAPHGK
jgi:putative oxidoreductase